MGLFSGILNSILPIAGTAIGTSVGGPTGGAIGGAIGSAFGQHSANQANAAASRETMDFQERMRDTSFQAAVADMRKAGLNPAMMYATGGSGAAVPVGSTPQHRNVMPPEIINSALQAASINQQNKAIEAQVRNTDADTLLKLTEHGWIPDKNLASINAMKGQADVSRTQANLNEDMLDQIKATLAKMKADTHLSEASAEQVRSQNMAIKQLSAQGEHGATFAAILQLLLGRR